jgi:hypothetical protein
MRGTVGIAYRHSAPIQNKQAGNAPCIGAKWLLQVSGRTGNRLKTAGCSAATDGMVLAKCSPPEFDWLSPSFVKRFRRFAWQHLPTC